ncbi:MAG: TRAP transporter small permease subunit [Chloroflexi bacterium]|nr:TRAP transporter small permease subunit [Chloroflexota bacterium]
MDKVKRLLLQTVVFIERLAEPPAVVGGIACIIMVLVICFEVVMRYIFNAPSGIEVEIVSYLLLFAVFLTTAYTLRTDHHVRVDLFISRLSQRTQTKIGVFTNILGLIYCVFLTKITSELVFQAYRLKEQADTALGTLLYPILLIIPVGSLLLTIQFIPKIYRAIVLLLGQAAEDTQRESH